MLFADQVAYREDKEEASMENAGQHLQQIYAVITTLEAAQRQCRDVSVEGLILAAMYSAETLQETLQKAVWSRMAAKKPKCCQLGETDLQPHHGGSCPEVRYR